MPYVEYDEVEAICSDCGRMFRSEEALAHHRGESHSGSDLAGSSTPVFDALPCPECRETFESAEAVRVHRRRNHRG